MNAATNLTTFMPNATTLRVMDQGYDAGTAHEFFGAELALMQVGDSHGVDDNRGAYDWWPLTIRGEIVAELRDDASGLTIHHVASGPCL